MFVAVFTKQRVDRFDDASWRIFEDGDFVLQLPDNAKARLFMRRNGVRFRDPKRQMRLTDKHTFDQVFWRLKRVLNREGLIDEYFSQSCYEKSVIVQPLFPFMRASKYAWFSCHAVTGGSEGHYIHVDLISQYDVDSVGRTFHWITGKTFLGMEHALKIANRCAELLGA